MHSKVTTDSYVFVENVYCDWNIRAQKLNIVLEISKKKETFNKVFFVALDAFQTLDRPLQPWRKRSSNQSKVSISNLAANQQAYFQTTI